MSLFRLLALLSPDTQRGSKYWPSTLPCPRMVVELQMVWFPLSLTLQCILCPVISSWGNTWRTNNQYLGSTPSFRSIGRTPSLVQTKWLVDVPRNPGEAPCDVDPSSSSSPLWWISSFCTSSKVPCLSSSYVGCTLVDSSPQSATCWWCLLPISSQSCEWSWCSRSSTSHCVGLPW